MKKAKLVFALLAGLALPPAILAAQYGATDTPAADTQAKDMPATQGPGSSGTPMMRGAEGPMRDTAGETALFDQLDANKDGYVDTKEADKSATAKAKFKTLDQNRDSKISREEWKAGGN